MKPWFMPKDVPNAKNVRVFSGGACNIRDGAGALLRNPERDHINDWMTEENVLFFDPQIHPDTHGTEYVFDVHFPMENMARESAIVHLYEISPRTFGSATSLEIGVTEFQRSLPTVIFFSDGRNHEDVIPSHTEDGYPIFSPYDIWGSEVAMRSHYNEMIKNANQMRKYLIRFAEILPALTITFSNETFEGDVVITPDRIHAVDMFRAVVRAASGKRAVVNFTGGEKALDEKGNPLFIAPPEPLETQLRTKLDEYVDEGNALRRAICELVRINVFARVVYTQETAIRALEDLMKITKLI